MAGRRYCDCANRDIAVGVAGNFAYVFLKAMNKMTRVARLLTCPEISRRSRIRILAEKVRRTFGARTKKDLPVGVRGITVWLGAETFDVDWYVLNEIFLKDEYAAASFINASVVDLGAHKGYFAALAFARGATRVVSYEPEPANYARLRASATARSNWQVYELAVSDRSGVAQLEVDTPWTHSLVPRGAGRRSVQVGTVALSEVLSQVAPASRTIVKIDIEGAEGDVLAGTPTEPWQEVDEVLIEVHRWASSDDEIVQLLQRAGFYHAPYLAGAHTLIHFSRGQ